MSRKNNCMKLGPDFAATALWPTYAETKNSPFPKMLRLFPPPEDAGISNVVTAKSIRDSGSAIRRRCGLDKRQERQTTREEHFVLQSSAHVIKEWVRAIPSPQFNLEQNGNISRLATSKASSKAQIVWHGSGVKNRTTDAA